MKFHNQPIPEGKMGQFHEILKACGGRYLRNPEAFKDEHGAYRVSYEYDSADGYNEHVRRWRMATTPIIEKVKRAKSAAFFARIKAILVGPRRVKGAAGVSE